MTFPIPANASTTVLALVGAVVSFLQVVIGTPLLQRPASLSCSTTATPFAFFAAANCCIGLVLALAVKKDYRRQAAEAAVRRNEGISPEMLMALSQTDGFGEKGDAFFAAEGAGRPGAYGTMGSAPAAAGGGRVVV